MAELAGDNADTLLTIVEQSPNPAASLRNLQRWLAASGSPGAIADYLAESRTMAELVISMMGASQYAADILIQNPELAWLVLDPGEVSRPLERENLLRDGRRLLEHASSYAHRLDRLRFLQQGAIIRIIVADLSGIWAEPVVWRALSDLADAVIELAAEVAWQDYAQSRDLALTCPVSIVGMGKLGGRELNFSSDIDLVYLLDDQADERMEVHAARFAEKLGRALSDRMSRGSLYRVDLRLRPFGRSGPIAPRLRAVEAYTEKYAEPWEHLALIRSRVVVGSEDVIARWDRMRFQAVFKPHRGEWAVEQILDMRQRLEDRSDDFDLKRGPGGIRDAEFTAQVLQMLFGAERPTLQGAGTLDALVALQTQGLIPVDAARQLSEGYTFLRQVEHRCQLVDDQQTHRLPEDAAQRFYLARRMGFVSVGSFESNLAMHRARVRHWYRELLHVSAPESDRDEAKKRLAGQWPEAALWLDHLAAPDAYWRSLVENASSLDRVRELCRAAPAFVVELRKSEALTEQVFSGEILEDFDPGSSVRSLKQGWDARDLANRMRVAWVKSCARTSLDAGIPFGPAASVLAETVIRRVRERHAPDLTVVALGSLAGHSMLPFSDCDLVLLYDEATVSAREAESQGQSLLKQVQELRAHQAPISLDLRLRPEGRQGPVASSRESFRVYRNTRLEPWERMAMSRHRLLAGDPAIVHGTLGEVLAARADVEEMKSLLSMKMRIEQERVSQKERDRHIKLGPGGQDDILWLIHLWLRVRPDLRHEGIERVETAIPSLIAAGILDEAEGSLLSTAWDIYLAMRFSMAAQGWKDAALPADLDKIADQDQTAWADRIKCVQDHMASVRKIFDRHRDLLIAAC